MQGNEGKIAGNALRGITADGFLLAADQFVVSQVGEIEGRKDSSPHHSGKRCRATGLAVPATPQLPDHQKIHHRKADQTGQESLL